jgi:Ion channel
MDWFLIPLGVFLIFAGILDVFFTVLHYDGFGFLSSRLYHRLYGSVRFLTRLLPRRYRALGLSMAAPLMVPATIVVWILLLSWGYAFIYYKGMLDGNFSLSVPSLDPSFWESLYFSGITISTLGLGDVTPTSGLYQVIAVSEALNGFGILTLAITYVLGIYGVFQQLGVLAAGLYHQAQDTRDPLSILTPHFPEGQHRGLETHMMQLHRGLVEIYEGMRRYPIVYYYHSRRAYRSHPYALRMIGGMVGALRWGLPAHHPGSQTPWLPTLITGLEDVVFYLDDRFLSENLKDAPDPAPFETFEAALLRGKDPADPWLADFLRIDAFMRDLACLDGDPEPVEAYARYGAWLPFAHRNRTFYEALARDLGYELDQLEGEPGELTF